MHTFECFLCFFCSFFQALVASSPDPLELELLLLLLLDEPPPPPCFFLCSFLCLWCCLPPCAGYIFLPITFTSDINTFTLSSIIISLAVALQFRLRSSPPIAPDLPSGADSHIPDARSGSRTLTTQLQQCNTGWHSSLPGMPFAVGAQRGGTTHLPSATTRPHL